MSIENQSNIKNKINNVIARMILKLKMLKNYGRCRPSKYLVLRLIACGVAITPVVFIPKFVTNQIIIPKFVTNQINFASRIS